MRKSNKKGFTVVELVIVIAIIAILAAVLIPTFAGLIQKANESKDTQLVKNLNTALAVDNKEHKTMTSALEAAAEFGYDVGKINASATGNEILWDSVNDLFCYYNKSESKIQYIPNFEPAAGKTPATYQLWKIYDGKNGNTVPAYDSQTYSIYWAGEDAPSVTEVKVGFDAGTCTKALSLTYRNTGSAQKVVIRTNGGTLTVNAPDDTVWHYGNLSVADIQAVDDTCYFEHGIVGTLSIRSGAAIIDNGGVVAKVDIVGDTDSTTKRATLSKQNGGLIYEVPASVTVAEGETATDGQICAPSTDEEKSKYGYIVASAEDLYNLRTMVENGTYNPTINIVIVSDIVVSQGWTPIGNTSDTAFSGTIIGNNHKISGLTNSFIKYASGNLSVSDLTLDVSIKDSTADFVGGLLGVYDLKDKTGISAKVLIDSVVVNGSIHVHDQAGGIVGSSFNDNSGSNNKVDFVLRNCVNNATVSAKRAGGMMGTSAGYFAKDKDDSRTGTTFRVTFDHCTNDAEITSTQDSSNYRAGGFIGYCGGSGNYVFTSVTNNKTDMLIGISRIGGTPAEMKGNVGVIDKNAATVVMDDYDYYQGRTTETITCTLWTWHDTLSQTNGYIEISYSISEDKLTDNEWRFTFDGEHYRFTANKGIKVEDINDANKQTSHSPVISSNPNAYLIDGAKAEYKDPNQINNSGTENTLSGWVVTLGEGTYSFNPTNYFRYDDRNSRYNISQNDDNTWTVTKKS